MTDISCGVIVTNGRSILLGHATASPRWDIPKGLCEAGETYEAAACRELAEETGLRRGPADLAFLGRHRYRPGKDLALFICLVTTMPAIESLVCKSTFLLRGRLVPEFDRFACPDWQASWAMLGKSMAAVLRPLVEAQPWYGSDPVDGVG